MVIDIDLVIYDCKSLQLTLRKAGRTVNTLQVLMPYGSNFV